MSKFSFRWQQFQEFPDALISFVVILLIIAGMILVAGIILFSIFELM